MSRCSELLEKFEGMSDSFNPYDYNSRSYNSYYWEDDEDDDDYDPYLNRLSKKDLEKAIIDGIKGEMEHYALDLGEDPLKYTPTSGKFYRFCDTYSDFSDEEDYVGNVFIPFMKRYGERAVGRLFKEFKNSKEGKKFIDYLLDRMHRLKYRSYEDYDDDDYDDYDSYR